MKTKEYVIPQVRMFFKAEGRANLFDMLRRIKTYARQTYTRCVTGSVVMFDYAESPLCTNGRFRISELTSNVPYAVHKQRSLCCSFYFTE